MYRSAEEVWKGLGKNATEGMASPGRIGVFTALLFWGQVMPLVVLICAWMAEDEFAVKLSVVALGLGYAIRGVSAARYRQSWIGAALHPIGIAVLLALQWDAFFDRLRGRPATWKQRAYRVE